MIVARGFGLGAARGTLVAFGLGLSVAVGGPPVVHPAAGGWYVTAPPQYRQNADEWLLLLATHIAIVSTNKGST